MKSSKNKRNGSRVKPGMTKEASSQKIFEENLSGIPVDSENMSSGKTSGKIAMGSRIPESSSGQARFGMTSNGDEMTFSKNIPEFDGRIFKSNKNFLFFVITILCFAVIFYPYFTVIVFSILTAYFVYPLFKFFRKKFGETLSLIFTILATLVIVFVPVYLVGRVTYSQLETIFKDTTKLVTNITTSSNLETGSLLVFDPEDKSIESYSKKLTSDFKDLMQKYTITSYVYDQIDGNEELVQTGIKSLVGVAKNIGQRLLSFGTNVMATIPDLIIKLLLYFFLTSSLILKGPKIVELLKGILPLDSSVFDLYLVRIKSMTNGVIKGNFMISLIQSALTTLSFIIVGIPYSGLIFIIGFFLYFPMIGSFPLFIPATIYLLIKGQYIFAIFILIFNSIVVSNVDNLLRGKFTPKEANIESSLMILSVLSGVALFGLMGILYGPIITIIGLTSIKVYKELNEKIQK